MASSSSNFMLAPVGDAVEVPCNADQRSRRNDRACLVAIYESYASLYPNPRLSDERQEADRLIRAVSAASHATQMNPPKEKRKGFFGFLFGENNSEEEAKTLPGLSGSDVESDERLVYTDKPPAEGEEEMAEILCGTGFSLDTTCIPQEAHSVARFHLSSVRTRGERPNIARATWETAGTNIYVITGVGEILEFARKGSTKIQHTSDREDLLKHIEATGANFSVAYVRAASVGPNFLVISWGLTDGIVVCYRRRHCDEKTGDCVAWEAVGFVNASDAVRSNVEDIFMEENEAGSALLRVSDVVPMVVDVPDGVPAATLAIGRLGGYIELLPVPPRLWYGPELKTKPKKSKQRRHPDTPGFYVAGLFDILAAYPESVQAMTTAPYHADVMCLESFRTSVSAETEWDNEAFPDAPPAEYVIVASGTLDGNEVASFWSVSILLPEEEEEKDPASPQFSVHASIVEALDIGAQGQNMSVFATDTIFKSWRKPRDVQLREEAQASSTSQTPREAASSSLQVSTVSVPAPVVSIKFLMTGTAVYATVLDWNGGLSIMECGLLERVVSQSLSREEYELIYRNDDPESVVPLARMMVDRSHLSKRVATNGTNPPCIADVRWVVKSDTAQESEVDESANLLAVLTKDETRLKLLPVSESGVLDVRVATSTLGTSSALASNVTNVSKNVAVISNWKSQSAEHHEVSSAFSLSVLNVLEHPRYVVQCLAQKSKFKEALEAASLLNVQDAKGISEVIEHSKKHKWVSKRDIDSLAAVKDDAYVAREALAFKNDSNGDASDKENSALFRSLHKLAIDRVEAARKAGARGTETFSLQLNERFVKLGTYELLCQHILVEPSFEVFCSQFLQQPMPQLAFEFAAAGDLEALSIVCCRHRSETMTSLNVINAVHVGTLLQSYHHLLPVLAHKKADGVNHFLSERADSGWKLDSWANLPEYLESRFGVIAIMDEYDRQAMLAFGKLTSAEGGTVPSAELGEWYENRAHEIQRFSLSLEQTIEFCRLALIALDFEAASSGNLVNDAPDYAVSLHRMLKRSEALASSVTKDPESNLAGLDLSAIQKMEFAELFTLIFDGVSDKDEFHFRTDNILIPLLSFPRPELGAAVFKECMQTMDQAQDIAALSRAIRCCANFATLSCSEMDSSSRLIVESTRILFMLGAAIHVTAIKFGSMSMKDRVSLTQSLWEIYEALPAQSSMGPSADGFHGKADALFDKLVALDIISRWSGTSALDPKSDIGDTACKKILVEVCSSFCTQIFKENSCDVASEKGLLAALVSDISQLTRLKNVEPQTVQRVVMTNFFEPLLSHRKVGLVDHFLEEAHGALIDKENVVKLTLSLVQDALFAEGDCESSVLLQDAAIVCQNIIKRHFPEEEHELEDVKRCLDIVHYINAVLLVGTGHSFILNPAEVRESCGIDVVDSLLYQSPLSIVCDCQQWADPDWAQEANLATRNFFVSRTAGAADTTANFPPPPARALFYLAEQLGLNSGVADAIAVKCLIIRHGIRAKLFGAMAAICRTFFVDNEAAELNETKYAAPILQAIASVVTQPEYVDFETKNELSSQVILKVEADIGASCYEAYDAIRTQLMRAEYGSIAIRGLVDPDGRSQANAIRTLHADTLAEYSTDVFELFTILQGKSADYDVDDPLLITLARFALYWCISKSSRPQTSETASIKSETSAAVFALACSLLGHTSSGEMVDGLLQEVSRILKDQEVGSRFCGAEDAGTHVIDMELVRRLMGRGYSELGARRAVRMSENKGFDAAMRWAVSHSLDADFDSPLVFVRRERGEFVDSNMARRLVQNFSDTSRDKLVAALLDIRDLSPDVAAKPSKADIPMAGIANGFGAPTPGTDIVHQPRESPDSKTAHPAPPNAAEMTPVPRQNGATDAPVDSNAEARQKNMNASSGRPAGTTSNGGLVPRSVDHDGLAKFHTSNPAVVSLSSSQAAESLTVSQKESSKPVEIARSPPKSTLLHAGLGRADNANSCLSDNSQLAPSRPKAAPEAVSTPTNLNRPIDPARTPAAMATITPPKPTLPQADMGKGDSASSSVSNTSQSALSLPKAAPEAVSNSTNLTRPVEPARSPPALVTTTPPKTMLPQADLGKEGNAGQPVSRTVSSTLSFPKAEPEVILKLSKTPSASAPQQEVLPVPAAAVPGPVTDSGALQNSRLSVTEVNGAATLSPAVASKLSKTEPELPATDETPQTEEALKVTSPPEPTGTAGKPHHADRLSTSAPPLEVKNLNLEGSSTKASQEAKPTLTVLSPPDKVTEPRDLHGGDERCAVPASGPTDKLEPPTASTPVPSTGLVSASLPSQKLSVDAIISKVKNKAAEGGASASRSRGAAVSTERDPTKLSTRSAIVESPTKASLVTNTASLTVGNADNVAPSPSAAARAVAAGHANITLESNAPATGTPAASKVASSQVSAPGGKPSPLLRTAMTKRSPFSLTKAKPRLGATKLNVNVTAKKSEGAEATKPQLKPTSTVTPTSSSARAALLRRGQLALSGGKNAGAPSSEERKRLIAEGRRLLQHARESRNSTSPRVAAPTRTSPKSSLSSSPTSRASPSAKPSPASNAAATTKLTATSSPATSVASARTPSPSSVAPTSARGSASTSPLKLPSKATTPSPLKVSTKATAKPSPLKVPAKPSGLVIPSKPSPAASALASSSPLKVPVPTPTPTKASPLVVPSKAKPSLIVPTPAPTPPPPQATSSAPPVAAPRQPMPVSVKPPGAAAVTSPTGSTSVVPVSSIAPAPSVSEKSGPTPSAVPAPLATDTSMDDDDLGNDDGWDFDEVDALASPSPPASRKTVTVAGATAAAPPDPAPALAMAAAASAPAVTVAPAAPPAPDGGEGWDFDEGWGSPTTPASKKAPVVPSKPAPGLVVPTPSAAPAPAPKPAPVPSPPAAADEDGWDFDADDGWGFEDEI